MAEDILTKKFKNQFELNQAVESFVSSKDKVSYKFSKAEKDFIRKYSGAGGQGKHGATGEGVLYEFYTPDYICELMYELAYKHGYKKGNILEPSCATGALIRPAKDKKAVVGFEINPISRKICQILYPEATIHPGYFETAFLEPDRFRQRLSKKEFTWLKQYPFDLVIGNPPYGKHKNLYSSYFPTPSLPQIEIFFMYWGMQLLKKNGLLVYLTSSNFMRNGHSYNKSKDELAKVADLVDAYRLPPVFEYSQVPTDILIFKKK